MKRILLNLLSLILITAHAEELPNLNYIYSEPFQIEFPDSEELPETIITEEETLPESAPLPIIRDEVIPENEEELPLKESLRLNEAVPLADIDQAEDSPPVDDHNDDLLTPEEDGTIVLEDRLPEDGATITLETDDLPLPTDEPVEALESYTSFDEVLLTAELEAEEPDDAPVIMFTVTSYAVKASLTYIFTPVTVPIQVDQESTL